MTRRPDDLPEEWHDTYDDEQHGWQRMVDEIDALLWLGKWAGIVLLVATAGWLVWHVPAAIWGRV